MSSQVTAEQVRNAVENAGITRIDHHDCSLCGYMTAYLVRDGQLYFNAGCNCVRGSLRPSTWDDAADWINMQNDEHREKLKDQFGFRVPKRRDAPRKLTELEELWSDLHAFLSNQADAEYTTDSPQPIGNKAMKLLTSLTEILGEPK